MRVIECQTHFLMLNESKKWENHLNDGLAPLTDLENFIYIQRFELKHTCRDPKDSELCLHRVKPGESLVEARSGSNVQIDRQM